MDGRRRSRGRRFVHAARRRAAALLAAPAGRPAPRDPFRHNDVIVVRGGRQRLTFFHYHPERAALRSAPSTPCGVLPSKRTPRMRAAQTAHPPYFRPRTTRTSGTPSPYSHLRASPAGRRLRPCPCRPRQRTVEPSNEPRRDPVRLGPPTFPPMVTYGKTWRRERRRRTDPHHTTHAPTFIGARQQPFYLGRHVLFRSTCHPVRRPAARTNVQTSPSRLSTAHRETKRSGPVLKTNRIQIKRTSRRKPAHADYPRRRRGQTVFGFPPQSTYSADEPDR